MLEQIRSQLSSHFDSTIVDEMLEHYRVLKTSYHMQDWEKCLVRGGKFGEAVMKAIHFLRTGELVSTIKVESEANQVSNCTHLPEGIRLLIPRAIRVLYDHRSKRGGAHSSSFDPNPVDSTLVSSVADWVLAEFIRLYCTEDPQRASNIVKSITARSTPIVERIGEDRVVLRPGASAREEIGMILYSCYPQRIPTAQLSKWLKGHSTANISNTLARMDKAKVVHRNKDGAVLTVLGLHTFEQELKKSIRNSEESETG